MCKKVKIKDTNWQEVEEAVNYLKLFEKNKLPMLTHGICPNCKELYQEELKKFIARVEAET